MSKQVLDFYQMHRLAMLGLNAEVGTLRWVNIEPYGEFKLVIDDEFALAHLTVCESIPAYTLLDLLDCMPQSIVEQDSTYHLSLFLSPIPSFSYLNIVGGDVLASFSDIEPIDAAFKMLLWLFRNRKSDLFS